MIEQVYRRKATRNYLDEALDDYVLESIQGLIDGQKPLFSDIDYNIDLVYDGKAFQSVLGGIVGSYGKVHAPHYLVLSTELRADAYENIGYVGENIVLKLTKMDIGTCWIGGGIKQGLFSKYLKLADHLTPIAVIAFGYPDCKELFRTGEYQFKRKKIAKISSGDMSGFELSMQLVRVAPSAANLQPWFFEFLDNGEIDCCRVKNNFIKKQFVGEMNRIDLGIALCHFEIGLGRQKMKLIDKQKSKKKYNYYKTIIIT